MKRIVCGILAGLFSLCFRLTSFAELPELYSTDGTSIRMAIEMKEEEKTDELAVELKSLKGVFEEASKTVQPFCLVSETYPVEVALRVENPEYFLGLQVYRGGKWIRQEVFTDRRESTIRFQINEPSVLLAVYAENDWGTGNYFAEVPIGVISVAVILGFSAVGYWIRGIQKKKDQGTV